MPVKEAALKDGCEAGDINDGNGVGKVMNDCKSWCLNKLSNAFKTMHISIRGSWKNGMHHI